MKHTALTLIVLISLAACKSDKQTNTESHRPQFHFTPAEKWMNDPNGMVYLNGTYHLFYQHYPGATVWGPMHWGHATSKDLINWERQPIALYPDTLGYIFSGSAVVDTKNTSGFGKDGRPPLVAIFTHHDTLAEKTGTNTYQNQSLAYSLDDGKKWTKYARNPVLNNPGIRDFRDPKVSWYAPQNKWLMTLATQDRITFYSSPNLKQWSKESEFGQDAGSHGGVWECPDLFPLTVDGKQVWVLLVSINPGGLQGGSGTQYFLGDFDGKTFKAYSKQTKWLDGGTDNYAGVTWANTSQRKIFMGWMSNWQYADKVPTEAWRSAMTIARELQLKKAGDELYVTSVPVKELEAFLKPALSLTSFDFKGEYDVMGKVNAPLNTYQLTLQTNQAKNFAIFLSNDAGEEVLVGYDAASGNYYIDRTRSGKTGFEPGFAKKHEVKRISTDPNISMKLLVDVASVELFTDGGLNVMTDIFFPNKDYSNLKIRSVDGMTVESLVLQSVELKK